MARRVANVREEYVLREAVVQVNARLVRSPSLRDLRNYHVLNMMNSILFRCVFNSRLLVMELGQQEGERTGEGSALPTYHVLDGGHRLEAVTRLLRDEPQNLDWASVPCVIHRLMPPEMQLYIAACASFLVCF